MNTSIFEFLAARRSVKPDRLAAPGRLEVEASSILDHNLEAARIRAFYVPLLAILPQLSLAAILWYGGRLAIDGQITLGTLVAFNSYLLLLAWPLPHGGTEIWIMARPRRRRPAR